MKHPAVQLLEELVAIKSVNPQFEDATRGEADVADYLEARCRARGLTVTRQPVLPGRDNLIIELRSGKPRPTLLLEAHMDTVGLASMRDPLTPIYRDGKLYARGSCDTKGSLAAMLCAVEGGIDCVDELSCDVILCATIDEEYIFRGVMAVLDLGLQVDGAVVGEPTSLSIVIAHKGVCRFAVTTHGKAAHSSVPEQGNSAITQMRAVLDFIADDVEPELAGRGHPLCGKPTIVVGLIRGGTQINIVPERCEIEVDRRVIPGESSRAVLAEFRQRLGQATHDKGVNFSIDELLLDEPLDTPAEASIVGAAQSVAAQLALPSHLRGVPYGSDASKLQAWGGVPTIVFGPGAIEQAHSSEEFVRPEEVEQATAFYAGLMRTFGK